MESTNTAGKGRGYGVHKPDADLLRKKRKKKKKKKKRKSTEKQCARYTDLTQAGELLHVYYSF